MTRETADVLALEPGRGRRARPARRVRPGRCAARLRTSGPMPANPTPQQYAAPPMFLREYRDVVCLPRPGRRPARAGPARELHHCRGAPPAERRSLDKPSLDFARSPVAAGRPGATARAAGSTSTTTCSDGTSAMPSPSSVSHLWGWQRAARRSTRRVRALVFADVRRRSPPGSATCSSAGGVAARCGARRHGAPVRVETAGRLHPDVQPTGVRPSRDAGDLRRRSAQRLSGAGRRAALSRAGSSSAGAAPSGPASTPPSSWRSSPRPGSRSSTRRTTRCADQVELVRRAEVIAGYAGSAMFHVALAGEPKHVVLVTSESYPAHNEYLMSSAARPPARRGRVRAAWCRASTGSSRARASTPTSPTARSARAPSSARCWPSSPEPTRVPYDRAGADHPPRGTAQVRHDVAPGELERGVRRPSRTSGTRAGGTADRPATTTWSVRC